MPSRKLFVLGSVNKEGNSVSILLSCNTASRGPSSLGYLWLAQGMGMVTTLKKRLVALNSYPEILGLQEGGVYFRKNQQSGPSKSIGFTCQLTEKNLSHFWSISSWILHQKLEFIFLVFFSFFKISFTFYSIRFIENSRWFATVVNRIPIYSKLSF